MIPAAHNDEIICHCLQVTESTIRNSIAEGGLTTIEQVTAACKAGGGCHSCHMLIQLFIDESQGKACSVDLPEEAPDARGGKKGFIGRLFGRTKS